MSLVNDFSLHVGCPVRYCRYEGKLAIIYYASENFEMSVPGRCNVVGQMKISKLLLRSLASITVEDMAKLQKVFRDRNCQTILGVKLNGVYVLCRVASTGVSDDLEVDDDSYDVQCIPEEIALLASLGYDTGVVDKDHKEIVGV